MTDNNDMLLWLDERKNLWWWVADVKQLSDEAILEGVLNYGRWQDFLDLKDNWGVFKMSQIFQNLTTKKRRVNLRPEKQALFSNYFKNHAVAY